MKDHKASKTREHFNNCGNFKKVQKGFIDVFFHNFKENKILLQIHKRFCRLK